jgi:hypothetical protein
MKNYDWNASNSAPDGCPMEIVAGSAFIFSGGGSVYIPPTTLHKGWGTPVSEHIVGEPTKPLPDQMQLTFYSYLEDKIYQGIFTLPHARIARLFEEGYPGYGAVAPSHTTYDTIIAGVAPGGGVAVWLEGMGRRVEVFFDHAHEVDREWHQILQVPSRVDRKQRREAVLAQSAQADPLVAAAMAKTPLAVWETYRTRYDWRPVFEDMPTPKRIGRIDYYNGERETLVLPVSKIDRASRPVPSYLDFKIVPAGQDHPRRYEVYFDEDEVMTVFQRLALTGRPLELVFRTELQDSKSRFTICVRNEREVIKLARFKREFFRAKPD